MVKNRLLATSIVALGMFYSAEGMNGLPKLNLTPRNTNPVNQFATVTQFINSSNATNLHVNEDQERILKSFQDLSEKLIDTEITDEEFEQVVEDNLDLVLNSIQFDNDGTISEISNVLVDFLVNIVSKGCIHKEYYEKIIIPAGKSFFTLWNKDNQKMNVGKLLQIIGALNEKELDDEEKINIDDFKEDIKANPYKYFVYTDSESKDSRDAKILLLRTFKEYYKGAMNEIYSNQVELLKNASKIIRSFQDNDFYYTTRMLVEAGFKTKDRNTLCTLDNYCLFIASRYFETLEDHINLTNVSKRCRGNMEKFHYNPISVNERTVKFFPNVETLHLYNKDDKYLEGWRIEKYVDWRHLSFIEMLEERKHNKIIEFKEMVLERNDFYKFLQKATQELVQQDIITMSVNRKKCSKGNITHIDLNKIKAEIVEISNRCFQKYIALTSIRMPSCVHSLNIACFYGCEALTSISIPSSVSKLGDSCFACCESLKNIDIQGVVSDLHSRCFYGCKALTSISIPSSVTFLGGSCFAYCESLKEIVIPDGVENIPWNCFYGCKSLTSIRLPSSVSKLGDVCFFGCGSLLEVTLPSRLKTFGQCCFANCLSLTTFHIDMLNGETKTFNITAVKDPTDQIIEEMTKLRNLNLPSKK